MAETRVCPTCGAEFSAESLSGLCPRCLLAAGLESQGASGASQLPPTQSSPHGSPHGGFVPPSPEDLAGRFPQLVVLELLGKGGMGAVYKARQTGLDRLVALKILPPEVSAEPGFAERFTREARALARLSHPHIVTVYDFGQADGLYYLVMEYVDGVNLRDAMRSGVTPEQALAIVPQVCEALQFAHDEGVVHRDVKPENILLDKRGRVKIADFGLAKLLGADVGAAALTGTHHVMGTWRYMAPEQMEGARDVDHRADIYSLGVVFYELLTGDVPMGRFQPPSAKVQVDVRIDEVVLKALEREPERRYQQASEVQGDVERYTAERSDVAEVRRSSLTPSAGVASTSGPWASAMGLAMGLVLLSSIFAMLNGALVPAERGGVSAWAWWAGAILCLTGGVAALVWAWRTYHLGGRANWLTTMGWTSWDWTLVVCGGLGLAMFAGAVVLARAANSGEVGGGIPPAEEALGQTGLLMGAGALVALLVRAMWMWRPGSSDRTPRSLLGQAWDDLWASRDRRLAGAVQIFLATTFGVCLIVHLGFRAESKLLPLENLPGEMIRHTKVSIGLQSSPWFTLDQNAGGIPGGGSFVTLISWSWLVLLFGMTAWAVHWQIEKAKAQATGKRLRWWHGSPNMAIAMWLVGSIAAVSVALAIGAAAHTFGQPKLAVDRRAPSGTKETAERNAFYRLGDEADAAFERGDFLSAAAKSQEYLAAAAKFPNDWNYGNAIHDGNAMLGLVALADGNLAEAKQRLGAAGKATTSPQLASFGPNLRLAAALLALGEKEAVLDYLADCKSFWTVGRQNLDRFDKTIRAGGAPWEFRVVSPDGPIGTWIGEELKKADSPRELAVFEESGSYTSYQYGTSESTFRREGERVIVADSKSDNRDKDSTFELRDGRLVMQRFKMEDVPFDMPTDGWRREGDAAAGPLAGKWIGKVAWGGMAEGEMTWTFDGDDRGKCRMELKMDSGMDGRYALVGNRIVFALKPLTDELKNALTGGVLLKSSPWSMHGDVLTIDDYWMPNPADGNPRRVFKRFPESEPALREQATADDAEKENPSK